MKLLVMICGLIMTAPLAFAQAPLVEWIALHGPGSFDPSNDVEECFDGGYIGAGSSDVNFAQAPDGQLFRLNALGAATWIEQYGGPGFDDFQAVVQRADGGFVAAGSSFRQGVQNLTSQLFIVATDAAGTVQTELLLGSDDFDERGYDIQKTSDGGYIVVGTVSDILGFEDNDIIAVKLSSAYAVDWSSTVDLGEHEAAFAVVESPAGGYAIAGSKRKLDFSDNDALIVKLDAAGLLQWSVSQDFSFFDEFYGIDAALDGGYIACGAMVAPNFFRNAVLVKTSALGVVEWTGMYGNDGDETATHVAATYDGGFVFCGTEDQNEDTDQDAWACKTDGFGLHYWDLVFGALAIDEFYSVEPTSDGGFILCGIQFNNSEEDHDGFFVKLGADEPLAVELLSFSAVALSGGIRISFSTAAESELSHFEIWKSESNTSDFQKISELAATNSASEQHYHFLDPNVSGGSRYSYFLASVDLNGNREQHRDRIATVTALSGSLVPSVFALHAFPNPFNPTTTLNFSLPEATHARIALYDVNGKLAAVLSERDYAAGSHSFSWDAKNFAAGSYFARLETAEKNIATKLLLLK